MAGDHHGRVVLITGASRGIGRAAAVELARQGATIIGTARSLDALLPVAQEIGAAFRPYAAEMSEKTDLQALASMVHDTFGRLDALFGNAGILGTKTPIGTLDDDDFLSTMAINVTSSYRLLHLFDPLLRRSEAGRVLFATSGVAWKRHAGWTLYAVSKCAVEAMIGVYANEIDGTPIKANLLSPGPIRTDLRVEAWPEENPDTVPPPETLAPTIADLLSPKTTENGSIYDFQLRRWTRTRRPE